MTRYSSPVDRKPFELLVTIVAPAAWLRMLEEFGYESRHQVRPS